MNRLFVRISAMAVLPIMSLAVGLAPLAAAEGSPQSTLKVISAEAFSGSSYLGNIPGRKLYGVVHLKVQTAGEKFQIFPDRAWCKLTEENLYNQGVRFLHHELGSTVQLHH